MNYKQKNAQDIETQMNEYIDSMNGNIEEHLILAEKISEAVYNLKKAASILENIDKISEANMLIELSETLIKKLG